MSSDDKSHRVCVGLDVNYDSFFYDEPVVERKPGMIIITMRDNIK